MPTNHPTFEVECPDCKKAFIGYPGERCPECIRKLLGDLGLVKSRPMSWQEIIASKPPKEADDLDE